jgi:hypothetical protein
MKWLGFGAAFTIFVACGGKAIVDGKKGSGGAGGAGSATNATSSTSEVTTTTSTVDEGSVGVTQVSAAAGPADCGSAKCQEVCVNLYKCGLSTGPMGQVLCPGLKGTDSELQTFLCGGGSMAQGCGKSCDDQPALAAFVDPNDCKKTIDFIKSASSEFANICKNGF